MNLFFKAGQYSLPLQMMWHPQAPRPVTDIFGWPAAGSRSATAVIGQAGMMSLPCMRGTSVRFGIAEETKNALKNPACPPILISQDKVSL